MTTLPSSRARRTLVVVKQDVERAVIGASAKVKSTARKASRKTIGVSKDLAIRLPGIARLNLPTPPVPDLLESNFPPSDYQAALILAALLEAKAEWQRLDTKLAQGDLTRKDGWKAVIRHKLELAAEFIRQHNAVLSPVRRLPWDIIQEIFYWSTYPHSPTPEWSDIPWISGHICRRWREVALSASFLWYRIPLIALDKKSRFRKEVLNELFVRSGDRLSQLSIESPYAHNNYPVVDVLIQHSAKWQTVKFYAPVSVISNFRATRGRLPNLRKLTIISRSSIPEMGQPSRELELSLDIFETAPALQEVNINGMVPRQMAFPFSRLLHYKQHMTWGIPTDFAFDSPLLRSLTLLNLSGNFPSVSPITLQHLVKLHLSSEYMTDIGILDNLTLPVIEELKLDSLQGIVVHSVAAMISRSPFDCLLRNLCIRTRHESFTLEGEIITLLQLTPQLLNLDISSPSAADIHKLASRQNGNFLVPLLQTCNFFINSVPSAETTQALKCLASSRCEVLAQQRPKSDDLVVEGWSRPIDILRLYFDSPFTQRAYLHLWDPILQQIALEDWNPSSLSTELYRLRRQLHAAFPAPLLAQDVSFNKWQLNRVDEILSSIESKDTIDPKDIYSSEIHLSLQRLRKLKILNDNTHNISNRARAILNKWNVLFEQGLKERHWVFHGMNSIMYISDDHALRNSPESLSIVYGLPGKGVGGCGDVFWPMNQ
ncbi:hypothetical protein CPB84DRAFT_1744411 [Gymnopilus junonius]|uniref:F-box domain-containing protein n=1 Tax=Gymnopilus junonius TaxID=109634 RepID=A0A9P5NV70_GYMJU|nr:hypothetical protein CPB84DRAFT_1744411 [Gymnopilus junonius]